MVRHQAPRVLRVGIVLVDAGQRFLERGEALREQVDLGLGRSREGAAGAEEGILREHSITDSGRIRDTIYFSVLEQEWPGVRAGLERRL